MKVFILISTIVAIASAGIAPIVIIPSNPASIRSQQRDSAIVQSERFGGNFAYAIAEGQAFRTVSPVLSGLADVSSFNWKLSHEKTKINFNLSF